MIFDKVKAIIAEQLDVDAGKITMETSLTEDLKADSLDVVELIMDLEQEFGLEIPDEELSNMNTVKDIINYIESNNK